MTDRIGEQLGNYRLTRLLGQGGFSEVYLGEHPLLKTTVAIKVLHAHVSQEDVAQFQEEARILASLKHPHIVRVLDFGLDGQMPYLVMDYAPNGTLRNRHARGVPLPLLIVVEYVKQISEGLQHAHDRKIVHRDIKPENMLIGEHDAILLSDFGIALITQSSHNQSTQDMAGTVTYMAPEQIKAHPVPASDQYSLGIVTYEWLCGIRPFHGSYTEIAIKHSVTLPPPLREHLPALSPYVEQVVLRALAKQPEERFASVSAFAIALEQASQDMVSTKKRLRHGRRPSPSYPQLLPRQSDEVLVAITPPSSSSVPASAIQPPPALPNVPAPVEATGRSVLSRRTALIGAAIAVVGMGVLVTISQQFSHHSVPSSSDRRPTLQGTTVPPHEKSFTYRGHVDAVAAAAWSPDGQRIASCSSDKTVQVWNANDGGHAFIYRGHTYATRAVAWSPDGKRIASGSEDMTVHVWDANDGGHLFSYEGHTDKVWGVTWSPDGKRIASCSDDKTVQVWDANDGGHLFTYQGHTDKVWSVGWSPDGQWIASGSLDKTVQVWNAGDGSNVLTYRGHINAARALSWSPDGQQIASGSWDATVQVWNTSNGSNVLIYRGHTNQVKTVAWSPKGQRIASGAADKTVQVWYASDGGEVFTYREHSGTVSTVPWSPDGKRIASGSLDNTVQVWYVG